MSDWRGSAACRWVDPEIFFPVSSSAGAQKAALDVVCDCCPVKAACGQYAIEQRIFDGVWGGMTEHERRWLVHTRRTAGAR